MLDRVSRAISILNVASARQPGSEVFLFIAYFVSITAAGYGPGAYIPETRKDRHHACAVHPHAVHLYFWNVVEEATVDSDCHSRESH